MLSPRNHKRPVFFLFCIFFSGLFVSCNVLSSSRSAEGPEGAGAAQDPVLIEVTSAASSKMASEALLSACRQLGVPHMNVFQWNNHTVLYGNLNNPEEVRSQLARALPKAEIKLYTDPFYEFNRKRCGDTNTAREWDHILLTANLVKDTALQREYLDYHVTQFQQWPEVSNGFCKASFQQLLLFKSGRQLMLVISIPKGESLDELNPKTTENNPRVDDWNALMKKYQEGISGTKPGEVWVFLKQVH
ncbi:L-rhamnose mutarotase [Paraflavisolibacter sp. H34]|uniref:L-rhamnose mutarotase n=1 Tax=Huijunlia imazamoxiresistens TaxID=3127457 RepID=UPI003016A310